ncbi:MAG: AI-2E family transporter [Oscillospiraceae bacterium]|nr:AI-2E family transporter [Oscillospiraceae bacterium]
MKRHVAWGVTALLTVCAILVVYDTFFSAGTLILFAKRLLEITMPILYGVFIAFLLAPLINKLEEHFLKPIFRRYLKTDEFKNKGIRALSVTIAMVITGLCVYLFFHILIPQLVESAKVLVSNAEDYYNTIYVWITHLLENNPELERWTLDLMDGYFGDLKSWVTRVMPQAQQLLTMVTDGIWSVITFAMDLVVGVIVSIYLLCTKESFLASARRAICALFKEEPTALILKCAERANFIFGGFVRGKLLDSLIIGFICYVGTSILNMPYAPLVSLVVGVTNVIPFFGPFLGAIPCALLILIVSPLKCLYFIIFVFALQQFDGNILGPKILGDSTGISSFWVIVAILVGGGFFGIAGMFFGVPVFACCYAAFQSYVEYRLKKKGKSVALEDYTKERCADKGKKAEE